MNQNDAAKSIEELSKMLEANTRIFKNLKGQLDD
ncbi:unnamed protein product, partial [marine sediment metagenome]